MIDLRRENEVFVLTMDSGENRISTSFVAEIESALDQVEGSERPAALVTTGTGKFYSTGLDLESLAGASAAEAAACLQAVHALFARLLAFPLVTVAAINGHAFAAGAMLALAHDFRVMREDRGFFCLPEIDLASGRPLTDGMTALISAKLERQVFHEAVVTGRRYGGYEARDRRIVGEALAQGEVLARAIGMAEELKSKDRVTMAALKQGMYAETIARLQQPVPESGLSG